MGAWGVGFNECDGALDFLGDLEDSRDWNAVAAEVQKFAADGYEEGEEAFAALEVVAAALGNSSPALPEALRDWAADHGDDAAALRPTAVIAAGKLGQSELSELWDEGDDGSEWRSRLENLKQRLQA